MSIKRTATVAVIALPGILSYPRALWDELRNKLNRLLNRIPGD